MMEPPFYGVFEGRRPEGLTIPAPPPDRPVLGDYFARAAFLEDASANAFVRLCRELEAHGAPGRLVSGCHRAEEAERRHAQSLARLAEDRGVAVVTSAAADISVRPLVAIALENVVEGVVRQTYGAVAARFRARSAGNQQIRKVMEEIAGDERIHAHLAFEIATWLKEKMDRVEIVWLENAKRHAALSLLRELDVEVHIDLSWEAGVPSRRDARMIWAGLSRRVWNEVSERIWHAAA